MQYIELWKFLNVIMKFNYKTIQAKLFTRWSILCGRDYLIFQNQNISHLTRDSCHLHTSFQAGSPQLRPTL